MNYTHKFDVNNKTNRTDLKFAVSMVIATVAILTIGSTSTTNVHAQVDCGAYPDDPSCQGSGGNTSPPNHFLCKIIVAGGAIILGHPELSPLGQIICEP